MKPMSLPIGFHFEPTDEELVNDYLRPKALGKPLPWAGVVERDLYASNPWDVFNDQDPWQPVGSRESVIYAVTKLRRKGKMTLRTAGSGTWNGKATGNKIFNTRGQLIGSKRMLNFLPNKGLMSVVQMDVDFVHWRMHEYRLEGVSLEGVNCTNYALCSITKNNPQLNHNSPELEGCSDSDMDALSSVSYDCDEIRAMKKRKFVDFDNTPQPIKMCSGPTEQQMIVPSNLDYGSVEEDVQGTSELSSQRSSALEFQSYALEAPPHQQPTLWQFQVEHGVQQHDATQLQECLVGNLPENFSACSNTSLEDQQTLCLSDSEMSLKDQEAFFSDWAIQQIFGDPLVSDLQVEHGPEQYAAYIGFLLQ